tara:strand:+ start:269 stop:475 length:207 start_codon:yes stop_codon:yes gene_type:complete
MKNKVNIKARDLEVHDSFRTSQGKGVYTVYEIEQLGKRIRLTVQEESAPNYLEYLHCNIDDAVERIVS